MKKFVEQYGKTIEEAIRKGLEELKISREDAQIEVIDEPTKGMLGVLSNKMAKVRVTYIKKVKEEDLKEVKEEVEEFVKTLFKITKEESAFNVFIEEDRVVVNIDSKDSGHLIGYKGKTIEALQSTINSVLQKNGESSVKAFVEVNGYKKQKEEKLNMLAQKMERNVIKFGKSVKLEPMSGYERMIIHKALANSSKVMTESFGEEPRRCVIIKNKR